MSPLQKILATYRATAKSEKEKGSCFEELIRTYFRYEATCAALYSDVWLYADWAKEIGGPQFGFNAKDTGIDLVAKTQGTGNYHAIQCKCYTEDYRVQKKDIDSFFTESGKKPFTHRYVVTTTNDWSDNAEQSLGQQQIPVQKIDLFVLEISQIDWSKYQPSAAPALKPKKELRPHQTSAKGKVTKGLETEDRGKLIMACGTGKTFTSLKIAEEVAGKNKRVLFLVPSLNLLSQTLTEWTQESAIPLHSFALCSMDDEAIYGNQLNVDDAARIIGCWKALSKKGLAEDLSGDPDPMRRAVAFCQVIERSTGRTRKVSSKQIAGMFQTVGDAYQAQEHSDISLICEAEHVDGGMNASQKEEKLDWLKAESPENTCRILSNVRCLSEGVDVPALDAVLFLTPRNSQVDVVQSVGRVMRNAPVKKRGMNLSVAKLRRCRAHSSARVKK
jgi:predicted helicase